ncbi:transglutaminase-like domain-containing protein [Candidatus Woesearchaeota archaeon]|nr:transglutaminase-like domain-containing protein [Candidatus Woesearchaeota archaeon]
MVIEREGLEDNMDEERYEDLEKEDDKKFKGPIKVILGVFLIFMIVLMAVPYYGLKDNPEPEVVIDYTLEADNSIGRFDTIDDVYDYEISKELREAASKIATTGCYSGIKMCQMKALYYFVRDNVKYVNDPKSREYFQTPESTLYVKSGDCDDKSILLVGLLKAIGVDAKVKTVPGHAYVQVSYNDAPKKYLDDEGLINLDSTCSYCKFGELPLEYS